MTAAQRATLEQLIDIIDNWTDPESQQQVYALRAALGTCGTCHWLGADDSYRGHGFCAAPAHLDPRRERFPFAYKLMPLGERCTGYTPKEGA